MKKLFFALFFFYALSFNAFAQYYEIRPEGLTALDGNDAIVVDVPNTSAEDLYKLLEKELSVIFPPTETTYNKETDNRIVITTAVLDLFKVKADAMAIFTYIMDVEYLIVIDVKDNKFRLHTPVINHIGALANFRIERMVIYDDPKNHKDFKKNQFIFNYKKRTVQNEEAKIAIENNINEIASKILNIKPTNEDW